MGLKHLAGDWHGGRRLKTLRIFGFLYFSTGSPESSVLCIFQQIPQSIKICVNRRVMNTLWRPKGVLRVSGVLVTAQARGYGGWGTRKTLKEMTFVSFKFSFVPKMCRNVSYDNLVRV